MKLYSLGILLCELLNGLIPFIDQPATLIMLEKEMFIEIRCITSYGNISPEEAVLF